MRRDLHSTTALTFPRPVYAPQAAGFIYGAIGGTVAAGATGAFAAGVAAGTTFAASAFGGIIVNAVVGIGLSVIAQALQPAPEVPKPSARMANFAQPVSYAEYVLGRTRKGGPLGFTGATGRYRYYVPLLAAHEIEGIVTHYLDERVVEIDGSDIVTTAPISNGPEVGKITPFLGATGQTANADLVAAFPGQITASHDFKGLAGAVVRAKKVSPESFSDIYPRGRQWDYTPVIDGHNGIYDPRDESTGHTSNAALILAWWLTDVMGQTVDWDDVATEADACDVEVTDRYGATGAKWSIDGVLADDEDFETQRAKLCAACDAFLYENTDGTVGFTVGRYIAPDVTLTAADCEGLEITSGQTGSSAITEIVPEYIEPDNAWREWSTGVWTVDPDGNQTLRDTPRLHMVKWHNQAIRIAKRLGKTKRPQWQMQGTIGPIGYELIGKRFFRLNHEEMGIDMTFEVGKLTRETSGTFSITANSVDSTDFDFDADTEEPERPEVNASEISDEGSIDAVTGVTATSPGNNQILVEWDAQDALYAQQILLVRQSTGQEEVISTSRAVSTRTSHEINGLVAGETYEVQVRNYTGTPGAEVSVSDWAPSTALQVVVGGVVPGDFSVSVATGEPGRARFQGVSGTNTVIARVYYSATDDFGTASQVGDDIAFNSLNTFDISVGDDAAVNLLTNGGFDADSDWTKGTDWSIASGVATKTASTASDLEQPVTITGGTDYRVTFTVDSITGGTITPRLDGATSVSGTARSTADTFQETLTSPSSPTDFAFEADASLAADIDDAYLVEDTAESAATGYYWLVPVSSRGDVGDETASLYIIVP